MNICIPMALVSGDKDPLAMYTIPRVHVRVSSIGSAPVPPTARAYQHITKAYRPSMCFIFCACTHAHKHTNIVIEWVRY